jgi:hypothetical protein
MRLIASRPLRLTAIGFLCGLFCALVIFLSQNALVYVLPHIRENCARFIGGGRPQMNVRSTGTDEANKKQLLLVGIMASFYDY